jgi:predicted choloylglycine hydrolase
MLKRFIFAREDQPDKEWLARFVAGREETERWYLGKGRASPASRPECRAALRDHMPELVPHYDRVCALVGDDDRAHQILSQYRPPPFVSGCSQAVWLGDGGPALVAALTINRRMWSARRDFEAVKRIEGESLYGILPKRLREWLFP